jgi:LysR family transcriptional regulator, nitrogen assimilation regulatory protein
MNLRSLRYFLKFTEYGSISRAALDLHITQPSLTQHLKHLETHFGVDLFMRHGRGIILTEAGKLLRDRGELVLGMIDGLNSELESSAALPRGTLSVGMPISWADHVTYPAIERFRREYPDVRIKLLVNASEALAAAMNNNEIQFAVLTEVDDLSPFWATPIIEDGLFLVGPATSNVRELSSATLEDLVDFPMILPLNSTVGLNRIDRRLAAKGLVLNRVMETGSTNILPLVARGAGFTALGAAALPPPGPDSPYAVVPISGMSMIWTLAIPRNRPKTAAVSAFEAIVVDQVKTSVASGTWQTARIIEQGAGGPSSTDADGADTRGRAKAG